MLIVSIETTLELWVSILRDVKGRMRGLFSQERSAVNAEFFLDGLLGDEWRKTGWMRAEAAGDPGPWRQQAVLGRDRWEADALRDVVRDYVIEHLGDEDAVLVIDETRFLKQGKVSCGRRGSIPARPARSRIARLACSHLMCCAMLCFFIDRAFYLPEAWTDDPTRLKATSLPAETGFATKPKLAASMIERATVARVPFACVAADTVFGVGRIENVLRRAGKGYVLRVSSAH